MYVYEFLFLGGGFAEGFCCLFFAHIFISKNVLKKKPFPSSGWIFAFGRKTNWGWTPKRIWSFCKARLFLGESDGIATCWCWISLPFLQDPCQFNQTKQAQAAPIFCCWVVNLQHPPQFQRLYKSFTSRFKTSQDFYSCLQNCWLPWVQLWWRFVWNCCLEGIMFLRWAMMSKFDTISTPPNR